MSEVMGRRKGVLLEERMGERGRAGEKKEGSMTATVDFQPD